MSWIKTLLGWKKLAPKNCIPPRMEDGPLHPWDQYYNRAEDFNLKHKTPEECLELALDVNTFNERRVPWRYVR